MGTSTLDRLRPGDHVCWTFDDDEDRLDAMVAYVAAGLQLGDTVLCFTDAATEVLARLTDVGVAVGRAQATSQLTVAPAAGGDAGDGAFDPDAIISGLARVVAETRHQGWPALRLVGDMAWVARSAEASARIVAYEAAVNRIFAGGFAMGLCMYDRRIFDRATLDAVVSAHPAAAQADMPAGRVPLLRIERTAEPAGLRLIGQADASNRLAVETAVSELLDGATGDRPAHLDLTALRFADVAAAHLLARAAPRLRLVGCSAHLATLVHLVSHRPDTPQGATP